MRILSTDVLVLGSGLAGLSAAIAAKEQKGLDVTVCSKTAPAYGSCTVLSQGGFRGSVDDFTVDDHRRLTFTAGYNLNDVKKVEVLVKRAAEDIENLRKYGVNIRKRSKGYYSHVDKTGRKGAGITVPMVSYAKWLGINFISYFFVCDIIKIENKAAGVWGFFRKEDMPTILLAKSVVLATGGAGALYSRSDNPASITGDGLAIAYRVGLKLMDMEFIQFYPLSTATAGKPGKFLFPVLADAGKFINSRNEDLVEKYGIDKLPLAVASRDTLCRAMAGEAALGHDANGAVKLKFNFEDDSWERARKLFGYPSVENMKNRTKRLVDEENSIPVMPVAHFSMGGVVTDERCTTGLPGLLAAGEVAGGLHGANRLGGNALSEAVVFGRIAGEEAAVYTDQLKKEPGVCDVKKKYRDYLHVLNAKDGKIDFREKKKEIRDLMWNNVGIIRSGDSLWRAKSKLAGLEEVINNSRVGREDIIMYFELRNIISVAEIIVQSALSRQESRGSHYRVDYPYRDDFWSKNIIVGK